MKIFRYSILIVSISNFVDNLLIRAMATPHRVLPETIQVYVMSSLLKAVVSFNFLEKIKLSSDSRFPVGEKSGIESFQHHIVDFRGIND